MLMVIFVLYFEVNYSLLLVLKNNLLVYRCFRLTKGTCLKKLIFYSCISVVDLINLGIKLTVQISLVALHSQFGEVHLMCYLDLE